MDVGAGLEYAQYENTTFRKMFAGGEALTQDYSRDLNLWKWSLFAQVSKAFVGERLSLSLGMRMDGCNYTSRTANLLRQFSPRFSVSYALSDRWAVSGNVGRYYQLPAYTTLGYADSEGRLLNKDSRTGYIGATHYVAGLAFQPGTLTRVTLEGFYKSYGHYPVSLLDTVALANKGTDYVAVGDEPVKPVGEGRAVTNATGGTAKATCTVTVTEKSDKVAQFVAAVQSIPSEGSMSRKFESIKSALTLYDSLTAQEKAQVADSYATLQSAVAQYDEAAAAQNGHMKEALQGALLSAATISAAFLAIAALIKQQLL